MRQSLARNRQQFLTIKARKYFSQMILFYGFYVYSTFIFGQLKIVYMPDALASCFLTITLLWDGLDRLPCLRKDRTQSPTFKARSSAPAPTVCWKRRIPGSGWKMPSRIGPHWLHFTSEIANVGGFPCQQPQARSTWWDGATFPWLQAVQLPPSAGLFW